MPARKTFLMYFLDNPSGNCWYKDGNGNILLGNIKSGVDVSLQHAPKGWESMSLEYGLSSTYWALNQMDSNKLTFYRDGADILRYLYYAQKGIEQQISFVCFKWNSNPLPGEPNYKLFVKALLNLPLLVNNVAEGVDVPLVQAGAPALLKAFENTIFQLPCDGSIAENFKINMDGVYLPDNFYYSFLKFNNSLAAGNINNVIPPLVYNGNDGDNFGIIQGSPQYESMGPFGNFSQYLTSSQNFLFQSQNPITITISGNITVAPYFSGSRMDFFLFIGTSLSELTGGTPTGISNAVQLVPSNVDIANGIQHVTITQGEVYYFSASITLAALQSVFLILGGADANHGINVLGGSLQVSFTSKPTNTRPWAMTKRDAFKLLMNDINLAASTTDQAFNYGNDSKLLDNNLDHAILSGDSLRASGDPNYPKFFNAVEINPNYPSTVINNIYGPVIKLSLRMLFEDCHVVLFACLSNQQLPGENESLFIEALDYVFDDSQDTITLGEVADFSVSFFQDIAFNQFHIGYGSKQYDQKAGKYEYNTTLEMASPLKSIINKKIEKISPFRYDSYGMERLRANILDTSTTRNDSDSDVYCVIIDRTQWFLDYFRAYFNMGLYPGTFGSNNINFNDVNNQNQRFIPLLNVQGISLPTIDGSYFSIKNDPSIFILNQQVTTDRTLNVSLNVTLNGNPANIVTGTPADTVTIYLYKSGGLLQTWVITATGAAVTQTLTYNATSVFTYKDCLYIRASTSTGATATINPGAIFTLDTTYFIVTNDGPVVIQPGSYLQMIPFTNTSAIAQQSINGVNYPIAAFGFQYFQFNEQLNQNGFTYSINVQGILDGGSGDDVEIDFWYNGFPIKSATTPGNGTQQPFHNIFAGSVPMAALGDLCWFTGDTTNQHVQITEADFTFTSTGIKCYYLKRQLYSSLQGFPLSVASDQPGAPYNIEGVTPKRLLYKHAPLVVSPLYNQIPGILAFSTLSKNQYLTTILGYQVIKENADEEISGLGQPLFYPYLFRFKTKVGWNFADLMAATANQHIHFTYNGEDFYGFVKNVKQELPLNPMETWELIASPKNNLQQLIDLNITGLNFIP